MLVFLHVAHGLHASLQFNPNLKYTFQKVLMASSSITVCNDCGMVEEDISAITVYPVNGVDFNTAIHTCKRALNGFSGITTRRCDRKSGKWSSPEVPCPSKSVWAMSICSGIWIVYRYKCILYVSLNYKLWFHKLYMYCSMRKVLFYMVTLNKLNGL